MERIMQFVPDISLLIAIALAARWYLSHVLRRGDIRTPSGKTSARLLIPGSCITAITRELLFRAPLVIAFPQMSQQAWLWMAIISALCAILLLFEQVRMALVLWSPPEMPTSEKKEQQKHKIIHKAAYAALDAALVILETLLGLIGGYYGIAQQSVLLCVGIRLVWDIIVVIVMVALPLIIAASAACYSMLRDRKKSPKERTVSNRRAREYMHREMEKWEREKQARRETNQHRESTP